MTVYLAIFGLFLYFMFGLLELPTYSSIGTTIGALLMMPYFLNLLVDFVKLFTTKPTPPARDRFQSSLANLLTQEFSVPWNVAQRVSKLLWLQMAAPERHYHDYNHILFMLDFAKKHNIKLSKEQQLAIWFHDAIYDVNKTDNEIGSWALLDAILSQYVNTESNFNDDQDDYYDYIVTTKDHLFDNSIIATRATHTILDLDLAHFSLPRNEYLQTVERLRKEYTISYDDFNKGRSNFLTALIKKGFIYYTPEFTQFEAAAMQNIQQDLKELGRTQYNVVPAAITPYVALEPVKKDSKTNCALYFYLNNKLNAIPLLTDIPEEEIKNYKSKSGDDKLNWINSKLPTGLGLTLEQINYEFKIGATFNHEPMQFFLIWKDKETHKLQGSDWLCMTEKDLPKDGDKFTFEQINKHLFPSCQLSDKYEYIVRCRDDNRCWYFEPLVNQEKEELAFSISWVDNDKPYNTVGNLPLKTTKAELDKLFPNAKYTGKYIINKENISDQLQEWLDSCMPPEFVLNLNNKFTYEILWGLAANNNHPIILVWFSKNNSLEAVEGSRPLRLTEQEFIDHFFGISESYPNLYEVTSADKEWLNSVNPNIVPDFANYEYCVYNTKKKVSPTEIKKCTELKPSLLSSTFCIPLNVPIEKIETLEVCKNDKKSLDWLKSIIPNDLSVNLVEDRYRIILEYRTDKYLLIATDKQGTLQYSNCLYNLKEDEIKKHFGIKTDGITLFQRLKPTDAEWILKFNKSIEAFDFEHFDYALYYRDQI